MILGNCWPRVVMVPLSKVGVSPLGEAGEPWRNEWWRREAGVIADEAEKGESSLPSPPWLPASKKAAEDSAA